MAIIFLLKQKAIMSKQKVQPLQVMKLSCMKTQIHQHRGMKILTLPLLRPFLQCLTLTNHFTKALLMQKLHTVIKPRNPLHYLPHI